MSRQERLQLKGRLAELKAQVRQLRVEIEGLRYLMRQSLPSYVDVLELDIEQAASSMAILAEKFNLLKEATSELNRLEVELY